MPRRSLIRAAIVGGWALGVLTSGCGDSPTTPSPQPTVPTVTQVVPAQARERGPCVVGTVPAWLTLILGTWWQTSW
jgi:hypothetical protein